MDFNYNRVIAYLKVAEFKSFSGAAVHLNISTGMVSIHIKELERSLGTTLISRTTRSLVLTEAGQRFYDDFIDIKQRIDCALETLKSEAEHVCGVLRIVSPRDVGSRLIVPIIAEFANLYPQLKIVHDVGAPFSKLAKGKHDLAICLGILQDSSFRCRKISEFRNYLIASPEFIERHSLKNITCLNTLPWIANEKLHKDGKISLRKDQTEQLTIKPIIRYSSNSLTLTHQMALFSLGIAILPAWMLNDDIKTNKLVRLFPNYELSTTPINILYPNCIRLPIKARRFIDYLVAKLGTTHHEIQEQ
ncbi:DNA-binding transcriptional regulator, LysR family [Pseudomonas sp. NFACC23-1]|uniref:LysR family transcriptional regulator n=1 Tax=unclassified Pseudomonas TaxID=196821 RepID=UPI0008903420|nr:MULTISPECIES: LysR family transcriptional regulator [unclassified Pseudomonas]SDB49429.1 DNA-binding transcriptional regulator, LysR family [Pseudomonas sp. NFACC17-2]SEJ68300.1 DNA-binding transcriptional regulator, LysR family [Pseudomonas sp. NFACC23-1]SFW76840.1 DNA-binding transcriptional regulator, LysR family [Pseudomonas sp. NFACC16-2]